jgi:hypothetical protein
MLCLLLVGRKIKKKRKTARGLFSQGQTILPSFAAQDFHGC